jgi:hypothetical protein
MQKDTKIDGTNSTSPLESTKLPKNELHFASKKRNSEQKKRDFDGKFYAGRRETTPIHLLAPGAGTRPECGPQGPEKETSAKRC